MLLLLDTAMADLMCQYSCIKAVKQSGVTAALFRALQLEKVTCGLCVSILLEAEGAIWRQHT